MRCNALGALCMILVALQSMCEAADGPPAAVPHELENVFQEARKNLNTQAQVAIRQMSRREAEAFLYYKATVLKSPQTPGEYNVASDDLAVIAKWPESDKSSIRNYLSNLKDESTSAHNPEVIKIIIREMRPEDGYLCENVLLPSDRRRLLATKAPRENEPNEEQEGKLPVNVIPDKGSRTPIKLPNEVIKAALDFVEENVGRGKIIPVLATFIAENPNSPFIAESNYMIGSLYTTHRREGLGEERDNELGEKHLKLAHEAYGAKFSYEHATIWGSLTNKVTATIQERKQYYDWLKHLAKTATHDDIFGFRSLRQIAKGLPAELSESERRDILAWLRKETLPSFINTAEENIVFRSSKDEVALAELATSYPDDPLGKKAKLAYAALTSGVVPKPNTLKEPTAVQPPPPLLRDIKPDPRTTEPNPQSTQAKPTANSSWLFYSLAGITGLCLAWLTFAFIRSHSKRA